MKATRPPRGERTAEPAASAAGRPGRVGHPTGEAVGPEDLPRRAERQGGLLPALAARRLAKAPAVAAQGRALGV